MGIRIPYTILKIVFSNTKKNGNNFIHIFLNDVNYTLHFSRWPASAFTCFTTRIFYKAKHMHAETCMNKATQHFIVFISMADAYSCLGFGAGILPVWARLFSFIKFSERNSPDTTFDA